MSGNKISNYQITLAERLRAPEGRVRTMDMYSDGTMREPLKVEAADRIEALEGALRELHTRTENFWALIQGEYGVKLSAEDHDDHNVYEFFAAQEAARRVLEEGK